MVEIPGPFAFGREGEGQRSCDGQCRGHDQFTHFPFSLPKKPPICTPDFPENEKIADRSRSRFPGAGEICKGPRAAWDN